MADGAVDEELVDELDAMGMVVGEVTRAEMRRGNLLHRSVFIVVRNDVDELLIHRRAAWKDLWPDVWDIAVSGVVAAGKGQVPRAVNRLYTIYLACLCSTWNQSWTNKCCRCCTPCRNSRECCDDANTFSCSWNIKSPCD